MVAVPAAIPVTTPVVLTVALLGRLLLHAPPVVSCVSCRVAPAHTDVASAVIALLALITVMLFVVKHARPVL